MLVTEIPKATYQQTRVVIPNDHMSPSTLAFAFGSFIISGAIHLTVPPVNEVLMLLANEEQAMDDKPKSARTACPSRDTSTLVYCKQILRRNIVPHKINARLSDPHGKSEDYKCGGNVVHLQSPQALMHIKLLVLFNY